MKTEEKDKLMGLFHEIKLEEPSLGFENKLMQRIHQVEKKRIRRRNISSVLAIIGGITGIVGVPILILELLGMSIQSIIESFRYQPKLSVPEMHFDPLYISIVGVTLFLLISDSLVRKHIKEKENKEQS